MSKKIMILITMILVISSSCDVLDSRMLFYRHIVTLDTNLNSLHFDNIRLDSNTTYPYTLFDVYQTTQLSNYIEIYPIPDSGSIHFDMFRGEGYEDISNIFLIDSLTLFTPIDTTIVVFRSGNGIDSIIINPNK